jgi:alpha-tubulin suppressor-like RCC1 family protein
LVNVLGKDMSGTIDPNQSGAIYPTWNAQPITTTTNVTQVVAGYSHVCILYATGEVQCWGSNTSGQLGNGTTNIDPTPGHKLVGFTSSHLASGFGFVCGQTSDVSNIYCWGDNSSGVINSDTSTNILFPTRVPLGTPTGLTVSDVAASSISKHVCTILSDGSLMCWGYNSSLQTGTGGAIGTNVTVPSFVLANW